MKAIVTIGLAAALLAGCSKSGDSTTASDASSPAADAMAATTPAAGAPAADAAATGAPASDAPASAAPAAAAGAADAGSTATSGAAAASSTTTAETATAEPGSGSAEITLPVYPGAQPATDKGMTMSSGTASLSIALYTSKDDSKTVVDWYKSHLPTSWKNAVFSTGDKTIGTFTSSEGDGKTSVVQTVSVTSEDGATKIQLITKKGN